MPEQTNPTTAAPKAPPKAAPKAAPAPTPPVEPTIDEAAASRVAARARLAALDQAAKEHLPGHKPTDPQFYSIDGEPIKVDLPDGRSAQIGPEPRHLHPAYWRAALAKGAASTKLLDQKQMRELAAPPATDQVKRRELIEKAIIAALDSDDGDPAYDGFFLPNGLINIEKLSAKVGFKVERAERDETFRKVRAEIEADDNAGSQGVDAADNAQAGAR